MTSHEPCRTRASAAPTREHPSTPVVWALADLLPEATLDERYFVVTGHLVRLILQGLWPGRLRGRKPCLRVTVLPV